MLKKSHPGSVVWVCTDHDLDDTFLLTPISHVVKYKPVKRVKRAKIRPVKQEPVKQEH